MSNVAVYPNPSAGNVNITNAAGANVVVTNLLGKVVYTTTLNSNNAELNLNVATGTYVVRIETENAYSIQKVQIVK